MKTIIEMAREAGGGLSCIAEPLEHPWKFSQNELERFAELARADEREACAKVCEDIGRAEEMQAIGNDYAENIRARGNT
jgi:hypothetical protein